jgi:uracil-DNA glycosylase
MKDHVSLHVHSSWNAIFQPIQNEIDAILRMLEDEECTPRKDLFFAAFQSDLASIRCVIVGQDPYPSDGNAMGLAFSVDPAIEKIPASLKNIFIELESDQGIAIPDDGDLTPWTKQGVLLLNRVLTTRVGESNAHISLGWQKVTDHIARELGKRSLVAILWGRHAQELAPYFPMRVESVHPSPLSAYRGFFGSKPFSKVNALLRSINIKPIDWSL